MTDDSVPLGEGSVSSSVLDRAKQGDEAAFRRLSMLYAGLVYHWSRSSGLSPEDTQDVCQQVFLTVHKNLGTFRRENPGDSFRAWLRTITRTRISDHFRKKPRELAQGGEDLWRLEVSAPSSSNDTNQSTRESALIYQQALKLIAGEFSSRDCRAFHLVTIDGLTAQEVADQLGMTTNAVYIAKSRILKRLRDEFKEVFDDGEA
jgi:RNA polymerase sigma-70 factor, ECF subfamily